ncbi:MAG: SDR family oxidoreductase [Sphingobium sp.]
MLLEGKSIVITGAGSGVGRAAAKLFVAHGAHVVCADINLQWAQETARQASSDGSRAVALLCDVTDRQAVDAAVDLAVERFGRLDVMYNNAGVATASDGRSHRLIDQNDSDYDRIMSINLRGMIYGCQAAVRRFQEQGGGGVIVNTASVAGLIGWGGVMYGASKGGVVQLTRALAIELASEGIRVNAVCPAGMMTNFGQASERDTAASKAEEVARYSAMHPLGRPIAPEDCANAALFLASDLSSNVTGIMVPVDGGLTAK